MTGARTAGRADRSGGMRDPGPLVMALSDPLARDGALVGGKAATLAALAAAGFPVPDGLVVTTAACAQVLGAGGEASLPPRVRAAVAERVPLLGSGPLAVRSSAVAEDSAAASHAGQYRTVLGVVGPRAALAAIVEVVRSASDERVRAYRRARVGAGDAGDGIAVLVQRQVDADAAGVAFTADPVTGDRDRTLVSAVRGLGDRLADGTANPEEWVVRHGVASRVRGGDEETLGATEAAEVAALAERVAAHAGAPQDVEWALAGGRTCLLQARPLTALPAPPRADLPAGAWIKESGRRAEPMTPLGASVVLPMVVDAMAEALAESGSLVERIDMRSVGGEVYLRIVPVGGRDGAPPPWWLLGALARLAPPLRARCRAARGAVDRGRVEALVGRWAREWRPGIVADVERLRSVDLGALADADLEAHLDECLRLLAGGLRAHFALMPPYCVALHSLATTCRDLLGWDLATSLELLTGCSGATSEPARAMARVAETVAGSSAARAALDAPATEVRERLREADAAAGGAFDAWCDRFGLRVVGDDLGATLGERPGLLAGLLRDAVAAARGTGVVAGRREETARRALSAASRLPAADRARFEEALDLARLLYPTREDSALHGACEPAGLARRAALEMGRRMAARGALEHAGDAAWLDAGTLRAAHRDPMLDARAAVARNRAEYAWTAAHPGPATRGARPGPPPDLRALPGAARRVNAALLWSQDQQRPPAGRPAPPGALSGAPGAAGTVTGSVRVVRGAADFDRLRRGEVLVCPATDPSWSVLFARAGGLVTESGGALSHGAIIAREYGVPAVLGVGAATARLRDGQVVTVDGSVGRIIVNEVEEET